MAKWVRTNINAGYAQDGRKKGIKGSFFLFINRSPWATDKNAARARDAALKTREMNMKLQAEHIIRGEFAKLEKSIQRASKRMRRI